MCDIFESPENRIRNEAIRALQQSENTIEVLNKHKFIWKKHMNGMKDCETLEKWEESEANSKVSYETSGHLNGLLATSSRFQSLSSVSRENQDSNL